MKLEIHQTCGSHRFFLQLFNDMSAQGNPYTQNDSSCHIPSYTFLPFSAPPPEILQKSIEILSLDKLCHPFPPWCSPRAAFVPSLGFPVPRSVAPGVPGGVPGGLVGPGVVTPWNQHGKIGDVMNIYFWVNYNIFINISLT